MKYMQSNIFKHWSLVLLLVWPRFVTHAQSPELQWAAMTNSGNYKDMQAMTTDGDGNTLVVIASFAAFNFAGSLLPHYSLLSISFGPTLIKLDPFGNILWHRSLRGLNQLSVSCWGIETDVENNIYVSYVGTSIGANASNIGGLNVVSPVSSDHFLVKISPEGNGLWFKIANQVSINGAGNSPRLTVAPDGCVYSCGYFQGTVNLDGNLFENESSGSIYLWKNDPDGNTLWTKKFASPLGYIWQASSLVAGHDGSVFITGLWEGDSLRIDDHVILNDLAFTGNADRWICKIAADGTTQWLVREHSAGYENNAQLTFTPENHLLAVAYTDQDVVNIGDILVNGPGVVLSRYSDTGEVISGIMLGNALGEYPFFQPPVIISPEQNSILIAYEYNAPNLSFGGMEVSNAGGITGTTDAFIAKVNSAGEAQWIYTISSEESEVANFIGLVDSDHFVVGGSFTGIELNVQGTALIPHTQFEIEHFLASFSTTLNTRTAEALQQLLAYPNPFSENVQFDAEALKAFQNATLTVHSSSGAEVHRAAWRDIESGQISLAHLPQGAYIAKISNGVKSLHTKIIKQ